MSLDELWNRFWWIAVIVLVVLLTALAVYFGGCSLTLESGIHDSLKADFPETQPSYTPTPAARQ